MGLVFKFLCQKFSVWNRYLIFSIEFRTELPLCRRKNRERVSHPIQLEIFISNSLINPAMLIISCGCYRSGRQAVSMDGRQSPPQRFKAYIFSFFSSRASEFLRVWIAVSDHTTPHNVYLSKWYSRRLYSHGLIIPSLNLMSNMAGKLGLAQPVSPCRPSFVIS